MKDFRHTEKQHRQPSLFGEILDWMLTPFLVQWPISMAIEYSIADSVASSAYDRELSDRVVVLSRPASFDGKRVQFGVPASTVAMLHNFLLNYAGLQRVIGCKQSVATEYPALSCLLAAMASGLLGAAGGALGVL